jgi:hypothetical protein
LIILIILGEEYKLWRASLSSFLQPLTTSSLFLQNILLSTLFSNTLSLGSSLNVRDQFSQTYKTTLLCWQWNYECGVLASGQRRDHRS